MYIFVYYILFFINYCKNYFRLCQNNWHVFLTFHRDIYSSTWHYRTWFLHTDHMHAKLLCQHFFSVANTSMTFLWSHEHTTGSTFLSIYYLFIHIFLYLLSCLPNKIIRRSFHSLEQGCPSPLRLTTRECSEATWTRRTRRRATTTAWGPSGAAASGERRKMSTYNPWSAYTAPKI